MTWRSTRCIPVPLLSLRVPGLQLADNRLGLALRPSLTIEPGTKRVDNGRQIGQQVFRPVLGLVHDFESTALCREQGVEVAEAEPGQAVLMLHNDQSDALIGKQCQELWARVIDARAHLFDNFRYLVATCRTIGGKALGLAVEVVLVLGRRHPCIDRYARWSCRLRLLLTFGNDDRVRSDAPALDFAVTKPAPGGLVAHTHLLCVVR